MLYNDDTRMKVLRLVREPKRVQARVTGFGVNANIPGIEVWIECRTSVRRKA